MSRKKHTTHSFEETQRRQEAVQNLLLSGDLAVVATLRFLGACEVNGYTPPLPISTQYTDMRLAWQAFDEEQHQYDLAKKRDAMKTLLIVESPHKAKIVAALAKPVIKGNVSAWACLGHLRDLPEDNLGVDIENGFIPEYEIPRDREKTVASLRQKILQADTVLLATDPDREGEAVAWHVTRLFDAELKGKIVRRATFNAITASAIQVALQHPRDLYMSLVTAAIARRVLDRLVGYFISPRLWKGLHHQKGLSAGRVQTSALRLLVEHESARSAPQENWTVEVEW